MTYRAFPTPVLFVCELAPELRVRDVQGKIRDLLGFSEEDFTGRRVELLDCVHPDDRSLARRLVSGEIASGATIPALRVRHQDGRIRCLEVHTEADPDAGTVKLSLRDVEEVWRCNEGGPPPETHTMLANTVDSVFFKNRQHVFTGASPAFFRAMSGYLRGRELVGHTDYALIEEGDADRFHERNERVMQTGVTEEEVHEVLRPGGVIWFHMRIHAVRDAAGNTLGVFVYAHNLTERVQAEERSPAVRDPQTGKIKTPDAGTYILDLRRGVFAASANLDSLLGVDEFFPHSVAGWESLIHPADRAATVEHLQSILNAPGRFFNREYRIIRPRDREVRWVQGIGRVDRDREGRPLVMRGSIHDISQRKEMEKALRETKERLQMFIEHAPAALAMFDDGMRYLAISERWRATYRVAERDLVGRSHYEVVPDLPQRWKDAHRRGLAGESSRCDEDRFERADGSVVWLRWELLPWRTTEGVVGGIILFIEDITRAKEAEERLNLTTTVFEHASEAIIVMDLNGSILRVNETFERVTGYTRDEISGRHIELLKSDHQNDTLHTVIARAVQHGGRWRGELWNRTKSGHIFPASATVTTVNDPAGKPQYFVAMFFDISPMKEQQRRLEHVVHFDALTGLPNRTLLAERLRAAMQSSREQSKTVGVVYFDLDGFKAVNDVHGKEIADSLLVDISHRIKQVLGEGYTLGRMGGDEFVVLLPGLACPGDASPILEKLLTAAAEPYSVEGLGLEVSATAGTTFYPQPEEVDADQLLRQADQAMYQAKLTCKGGFVTFDPAQQFTVRCRNEEVARIRRGLRANEFVLHYQPQVNMATGALVGAEALIRWQHPQRGLLLPSDFLPLIEEQDLAIELGQWVIDSALAQIERWAEEGHSLRVSVNVGARELEQPDFGDRLGSLLARHPGVSPHMLGIEVLESSALRDISMVSDLIGRCAAMGVHVAIDDFGTGYSSLTYLKRLPVGVLKIDQSFVHDMLDDADSLAILQGILGLANAFRRTAVAEGVETVGHGVMLLRLGCQVAQGFGIAAAMPPEELFRWYQTWHPHASWANATPVSPQDWPLLIAEVELNNWNADMHRYINGEKSACPELDEQKCRMTAWLQAEKTGPRSGSPVLEQMDFLHREVHRMMARALQLESAGELEKFVAELEDTLLLKKEMGRHLRSLFSAAGSRSSSGLGTARRETAAKLQ